MVTAWKQCCQASLREATRYVGGIAGRPAKTPLVGFSRIMRERRTNVRFSTGIAGRMRHGSDGFERQKKGLQVEYNETHGRVSGVRSGRCADSVVREGARRRGGFSSGSRGGSSSGSMGSRGSRTYQDNGTKPIEQSTTARPSATPPPSMAGNPATASRPAPAAQPSWFQRNPLLAGIAGGLAGTWLGHMIFGATDTSARTTDGAEGEQAAGGSGSNGMLLLLMVMGGGALWWYMRSRRIPAPNFSGLSRTSAASGSLLAESSRAGFGAAVVEDEITSTDKAAFQQALTDIQAAWSRQDLAGLRRLVTPEMLEYFSTGLAEQASEGWPIVWTMSSWAGRRCWSRGVRVQRNMRP